ncbi:MAG TPA: tyrosine-type recombinase/integrase [Candidatus Limnocylindrales bacterium]
MGWTAQLDDGRWRAFESEGSGARRVRANAIGRTERVAVREARKQLAAKVKRRGQRTYSGETFEELVSDYRDLHMAELSPTTHTGYESILRKHLVPYFGKDIAADIGPTDVLRFKAAKRRAGLSAMTVEHHLSCLRSVLSFGVRTRRLQWNAAEAVKGKKPRAGHPRRSLSVKEVKKILDGALAARAKVPKRKGGGRDDLYGPTLAGLCAGLRRGEVLALKWRDIDLKASALYARHNLVQKKGKGPVLKETKAAGEEVRPVLLPAVAMDALRAERLRQKKRALRERGWNPQGVVFPSKAGTWRVPDTLTHHFADLLVELGIEDADFHTLRHTHATWLRDDGIDPLTIRDRQGHADVKTTEGYLHSKLTVQGPAAASLQKRLSQKS